MLEKGVSAQQLARLVGVNGYPITNGRDWLDFVIDDAEGGTVGQHPMVRRISIQRRFLRPTNTS